MVDLELFSLEIELKFVQACLFFLSSKISDFFHAKRSITVVFLLVKENFFSSLIEAVVKNSISCERLCIQLQLMDCFNWRMQNEIDSILTVSFIY